MIKLGTLFGADLYIDTDDQETADRCLKHLKENLGYKRKTDAEIAAEINAPSEL